MRKYSLIAIAGIGLLGAGLWARTTTSIAAQSQTSTAVFLPDGKVKLPTGFRKWVFVGAPLTPNGLNGGMANFPEYHHVYVEQKNVDAYLKTGVFPEGTVIVKELTRLLSPMFPDGSRTEPSGRGFFNGVYNGIDMTVRTARDFLRPMAGASSPSAIIQCRTRRQRPNRRSANAVDVTSPTSRRPT